MRSDDFESYHDYQLSYSPSGVMSTKSCPSTSQEYWYAYCANNNGYIMNHQVRSVYDAINGVTSFLTWDADGQLRDVMRPCLGDVRHHWWNEAGQMVAMVDNEQCGYYGYNADGERMYKLTGQSVLEQYNAGEQHFQMFFNDAVLYVNPYMVVTPKGYTKHYYNGSRRIAAQVGDLNDLPNDILDNSGIVQERIQNARSYMDSLLTVTEQQQAIIENLFVTPDGDVLGEMQWLSQCYEEERTLQTAVYCEEDLLASLLIQPPYDPEYPAADIYYYHSDHLGSASWITNSSGDPVQYIHYMPYGELWKNQQRTPYNERFKFTGKERDEESGYDYFGARNYTSAASIWTSPDPLLDKYPEISSYAYCHWNPVKYVDPNGKWVETAWDVANVVMGVESFVSNIHQGNVAGAVVDGVGVVLDAVATVLPVAPGGAGTAIKTLRAADKVSSVIPKTRIATKNNYRRALQDATGKIGKGYEAHHTLPQKYRKEFEKLGINIDEPGNVVWRKAEVHRTGNTEHAKEWKKFFKKNPHPTKEQVLQQRNIIENKVWPDAPKGETPVN